MLILIAVGLTALAMVILMRARSPRLAPIPLTNDPVVQAAYYRQRNALLAELAPDKATDILEEAGNDPQLLSFSAKAGGVRVRGRRVGCIPNDLFAMPGTQQVGGNGGNGGNGRNPNPTANDLHITVVELGMNVPAAAGNVAVMSLAIAPAWAGAAGNATVTFTGVPAGVTVTALAPASATGGNFQQPIYSGCVYNLTTGAGAAAGTYNLTITVTFGGFTKTANATLVLT